MSTKQMIAHRIQQPEHPLDLLLDPATQYSTDWSDRDDTIRHGISACSTIEGLAAYFAQSGVPLSDDCLLVAMACDWSDDEPQDAHLGEILVIPSAIISATPIDDSFYELLNDAYDRIYA